MELVLQKVLWQVSSVRVLLVSIQGEIRTQRKYTVVSKHIFIKREGVLTKV